MDIYNNICFRDVNAECIEKLDRINLLIDEIISVSKSCYQPNQYLSLDETMINFRARIISSNICHSSQSNTGSKHMFFAKPSVVMYYHENYILVTQERVEIKKFIQS